MNPRSIFAAVNATPTSGAPDPGLRTELEPAVTSDKSDGVLESSVGPSAKNDASENLMEATEPPHAQDTSPVEPSNSTPEEALELTPHPCTLPPPESATTHGITCTTRIFLVDVLPPSYPYLPFRFSATSASPKFQIPFFCFSGPDPPPADIGAAGDVYIAAANTLYAHLPVHGWTRWTAAHPPHNRTLFKLGDAGLLSHPYFPDRLLWATDPAFSWYSLSSVHNARRSAGTKMLVPPDADADAAAKILVARTLQCGDDKKRRAEGREDARKKPRLGPRQPTVSKKAAVSREASSCHARVEAAAGAGSHLARLEAENAALRAKGAGSESQAAPERMALPSEFLGFMRETFAREVVQTWNAKRIEAEAEAAKAKARLAILETYLDDAMEADDDPTDNATRHPECATDKQTELEDELARAQTKIVALESKIDRFTEAAAQAAAQDAAALHRGAVYITEAQRKIAALQAEVAHLKDTARNETAALRLLLAARESATDQTEGGGSIEPDFLAESAGRATSQVQHSLLCGRRFFKPKRVPGTS
ncbi:hypothetical protein FB451DRAFT_1410983 [Mycena latifolia]|nr:hypothetical protein FB451DRAFT_1410983 [Mycena latifolia]